MQKKTQENYNSITVVRKNHSFSHFNPCRKMNKPNVYLTFLKVVLRINSVSVSSKPVIFPSDGLNVNDLLHKVTVI